MKQTQRIVLNYIIFTFLFMGASLIIGKTAYDSLTTETAGITEASPQEYVFVIDAGHGGEDGGAEAEYPYVERDISWMYFNQRILLEAARPEVPLLERLTFLGIYSNNLDEFFRVRVATLNRIVEYADKNIQAEQETAACTLKQIGKLHNRYYKQFEEIFASIMEELKKENIYVIKDAEMTDEQKALFEKYTDCVREHQTITECLIFQNSFKLGARMMLEVMEE